ncbi:MAG: adenosylmethionine-8-amino-7-oxononanoate aminotransferase [Gammaproteobacteria bacterium]|jgi:adenosylmethionine-8-amino-7-oxononanoate aminotransferase
MAHPTACAPALEVQRVIVEDNLLDNVRTMAPRLEKALLERFGNHPHVGDIRGRGLFQALEFVRDREQKTPFPADARLYAHVKREAMMRGLMCYPMGGTVDGANGDHVLLAPPFIVTDAHIDEIADKLAAAVDAAIDAAG